MALITMDDIEKISPVFRGERGNKLAKGVLRLTGIDQLAERYARHEDLTGPDFVNEFLKDLYVNYEVGGLEHLATLADTPFVTISNHPYGGLDGLILIDLVGHFRHDFKVMANQFLNLVKTIKGNFINVVPNTDSVKVTKESIAGVRQALLQVRDGHPLGLFPAGAVSDFHFREFGISDREWQESAIRLIHKLKVPVLPIRFFDRNSSFFYFLGLISWKVRILRLPREVLNKGGKRVRVGIGPVISVEEQARADLGELLRKAVYDMDLPTHMQPRSAINFDDLRLLIS
ncbi:MAG: 1-acyl-sn-glycerol-3-phosphate acyltransferase [Bacteroidales bacterium]|nr:1-acyl-sn-glycerol-3-phosphate acyltransferase [Bacteroidales bacterium]